MQLDITKQSRLFSHLYSLQISCISSSPRNGSRIILIYKNKQINIKNGYIHFFCPTKTYEKIEHIRELKAKKSFSDIRSLKTDSSKIQKNTLKKRDNACVVPSLSSIGITDITNLVGIIIGVSHISWARISLLPLRLLDWNAKALPTDFRTSQDEQNTLRLAYDVKHMLPDSNLYVMETFSIRGQHIYESVNMIQLSSMLTILLNGINEDPINTQKVVFQKAFVMNKLHGLLVGSERVSTRIIIEKILGNQKLEELSDKISENDSFDIYSIIEISEKFCKTYHNASLEKKEDLSLALLFTLSFLDVNIFKNDISLAKIKKKNTFIVKSQKKK